MGKFKPKHKHAADVARPSEEMYRIMVQHSDDMIWTLDRAGNFTFFNKRAEQITGHRLADWQNKSFAPLINPADLPGVIKVFHKTLQGKSQRYEVRIKDKKGATLVLSVNTAPLFRKGKVVGTVSFGHDVTKIRQQAEDLSLLYGAGKIFSSLLDEEKAIKQISRRCAEVLKVDSVLVRLVEGNRLIVKGSYYTSQRDKKEVERLLGEHPIEVGKGIAGRVARTGKPMVSGQAPLKSVTLPGYVNYLSRHKWLVVPMKVKNRVTGVLTFMTDDVKRSFSQRDMELAQGIAHQAAVILENTRLFEAVERSERHYRTILESSADAIITIDPNYKIVGWSAGAKQILGYAREEIINQSLDIIVPEWERPLLADKFQEARAAGFIRGLETQRLAKDGRLVDVEITITDLGPKTGYLGILRDITARKRAETEIKQSYTKLRDVMKSIVYAMVKMVEIKDPYTAGHHEETAALAAAIAREMGLSENRIEGVRIAGILHDISKIYIPAEVLNKHGRLTKKEMETVKTHPQRGYDILKLIEFPWAVAQIVSQHHERLDGSGYPLGLSGEKILLEARILAVADVVDAMLSDRPYRNSLNLRKALAEITTNGGKLYDPAVVDACRKVFLKNGFDLRVHTHREGETTMPFLPVDDRSRLTIT